MYSPFLTNEYFMLKDDFYQLLNMEQVNDNEFIAYIHLNNNHEIFKGHFPGQPVVPGVCMIQIVKELVSSALDLTLTLKSSRNIKFTALIDPNKTPDLKLQLIIERKEDNTIRIKNVSSFGTVDAVKMDLTYVII